MTDTTPLWIYAFSILHTIGWYCTITAIWKGDGRIVVGLILTVGTLLFAFQ